MPNPKNSTSKPSGGDASAKKRRAHSPSPFDFELGVDDFDAAPPPPPAKKHAGSAPASASKSHHHHHASPPPAPSSSSKAPRRGNDDVSEDITDLLGLLGDRLNKQFDSKKKQLESQAEKVLQSTHNMLNEHASTYQRTFDSKLGEAQAKIDENSAQFVKEMERLKKLQINYQQVFLSTVAKMEGIQAENQQIQDNLVKELRELRKNESADLTKIQKSVSTELKETQRRFKEMQPDADESHLLKSSLMTLFR